MPLPVPEEYEPLREGLARLRAHGPVTSFGDGETLPFGLVCMAVSESKSKSSIERCPKEAVVGISAYEEDGPYDDGTSRVDLCGGHYNVHRRGRELRVLL
jgi:hypothetical protein